METAPLTLAHTHARNAVLETRKSNPVAASEEHDLAAGEFATAAQTSADPEALRTLQLLEHHHKKLAQILRFQHEHPSAAAVTEAAPATPQQSTTETGATKTVSSIQDAQQQPPRLSGNTRLPTRETSSIASNLASARGIPSHPRRASPASPTLSSQQAGAKMTETPTKLKTGESRLRGTQAYGAKERPGRAPAPRQPWSPPAISPTDITSQQFVPADAAESSRKPSRHTVTEEPFQRFYSTFEGLINKISAPLAFAGLPLGSEQPESTHRKSAAEAKVDRHHATSDRSSTSAEPDIDRLFSRAALRAIRDTVGGSPGSTAESFYVVPTTGGTVSYAGILTRAEKEARRNSLEEGDEDFVDARETPASPEMRHSMTRGTKSSSRAAAADKFTGLQNPKTMEELQMENQALKHLSDTLSKRLHMWEVNAQSSSMALQQSLKAMHHNNNTNQTAACSSSPSLDHLSSATIVSSPTPTPTARTVSPGQPSMTKTDASRIKELEDLIQRSERELDKVGRENEKLRSVLGRYRERWEKLKEGAKTRRAEGKSSGADTSNNKNNNVPQSPAEASSKNPDPDKPNPSSPMEEKEKEEEENPTPPVNPEGDDSETPPDEETPRC